MISKLATEFSHPSIFFSQVLYDEASVICTYQLAEGLAKERYFKKKYRWLLAELLKDN